MKRANKDAIPLIDRIALSVDDAAAIAGVGRDLIYNAIADHSLVSRQVGSRRIILRADLDAWLKNLPVS